MPLFDFSFISKICNAPHVAATAAASTPRAACPCRLVCCPSRRIMKLCALSFCLLCTPTASSAPPPALLFFIPTANHSFILLCAYRLLRWRMSDFMGYSEAQATLSGTCCGHSPWQASLYLFSASNKNKNKDEEHCQQQQAADICARLGLLPLPPSSSSFV